jgi:hypothetical protein
MGRAGALRLLALVLAVAGLAAALRADASEPLPRLAEISPEVCSHPSDSLQRRLCVDAPGVFDPALGDWERTSLLRDWAYAHIDVSATRGTYDKRRFEDRSAPDIFEGFARDEGGVFCGNASLALRQLYAYFGYRAWTLDSGVPGVWTHTTTLVALPDRGGLIAAQGAYLGGSFQTADHEPLDIRKVIERLSRGRIPRWVTSTHLQRRDVLYTKTESRRPTWQFDNSHGCRRTKTGWSCQNTLTLADLARDPTLPGALRRFRADGHSANVLEMFLYPLGVSGPDSGQLLEQLKAASA